MAEQGQGKIAKWEKLLRATKEEVVENHKQLHLDRTQHVKEASLLGGEKKKKSHNPVLMI